uniref:Skp1_POZ domain-containing protein n=1 Tax=Panagrellus redivivus TaxID=6233 RepID=A0A7E4W7H6_PANRE
MPSKSIKIPTITVESNDGKTFTIDEKIIRESKLLKQMTMYSSEVDSEAVPLNHVDSKMFQLIVDFSTLFKDVPDYIKPTDFEDSVRPKETDVGMIFIKDNIPDELIPAVMKAANCLEVDRLMDYIVYHIINILNENEDDEIRERFMIPDEYERETLRLGKK